MIAKCCCLIVIASLLLLVVIKKQKSQESYKPNQPYLLTSLNLPLTNPYVQYCGPCIPSDADPNTWESKCIVHNADRYPLLYHTTTKTCVDCDDIGGFKVCKNFNPNNGTYEGQTVRSFAPSFAL